MGSSVYERLDGIYCSRPWFDPLSYLALLHLFPIRLSFSLSFSWLIWSGWTIHWTCRCLLILVGGCLTDQCALNSLVGNQRWAQNYRHIRSPHLCAIGRKPREIDVCQFFLVEEPKISEHAGEPASKQGSLRAYGGAKYYHIILSC